MATEMDSVNVPEQLLQHLLGQTNGSAIEREQIAAAVRQRLMTAEPMAAGAMTAAAVQPLLTALCGPREVSPQEFSSIDAKQRLKQELELRTQHPEENLKEFIYMITAYYDQISGSSCQNLKRSTVCCGRCTRNSKIWWRVNSLPISRSWQRLLTASVERYWRQFQYKPPPPPTDQVARDLAFRPAANVAGLSGAQPRVMVAAAAPFQHLSAASYWPLHPAAIQPSYHRAQLHRSPASAISPHCPVPPQPQGYQPLDGGGTTCHLCGGIGHMGRECPSGRRKGPPRCYQCNGI
ncbi:hypothetical protein HPB50_029241 [Hyalomma asiaticum]|nr:hypothetical protein HPB50_029241 [Hyalomma asiaticum]